MIIAIDGLGVNGKSTLAKMLSKLKNKRAQEFWRKIVKEVSNGDYREQLIRNNSRYAFYFEN